MKSYKTRTFDEALKTGDALEARAKESSKVMFKKMGWVRGGGGERRTRRSRKRRRRR